jgi:hypothetical protein
MTTPIPLIHIQAALQSTETFTGAAATIASEHQTEAVQFQFEQFNGANPLFQEAITTQADNTLTGLSFTGPATLGLTEQLDISIPMPSLQHLWV